MHGTKVTLAGRPAFLANHDVPIVVQQLTKGQIEAIPKDRFTVSMVNMPGNILFALSHDAGGATFSGLNVASGHSLVVYRGGNVWFTVTSQASSGGTDTD